MNLLELHIVRSRMFGRYHLSDTSIEGDHSVLSLIYIEISQFVAHYFKTLKGNGNLILANVICFVSVGKHL